MSCPTQNWPKITSEAGERAAARLHKVGALSPPIRSRRAAWRQKLILAARCFGSKIIHLLPGLWADHHRNPKRSLLDARENVSQHNDNIFDQDSWLKHYVSHPKKVLWKLISGIHDLLLGDNDADNEAKGLKFRVRKAPMWVGRAAADRAITNLKLTIWENKKIGRLGSFDKWHLMHCVSELN